MVKFDVRDVAQTGAKYGGVSLRLLEVPVLAPLHQLPSAANFGGTDFPLGRFKLVAEFRIHIKRSARHHNVIEKFPNDLTLRGRSRADPGALSIIRLEPVFG